MFSIYFRTFKYHQMPKVFNIHSVIQELLIIDEEVLVIKYKIDYYNEDLRSIKKSGKKGKKIISKK